ncbi:hypothetical protein HDV00_006368 [Rhizophlyctis rosea]|nr:hypothetical protein HDV00_006368 [Rhizophlyctis rosea]
MDWNGNQEPSLATDSEANQAGMEMKEDLNHQHEYNNQPILATIPSANSQTGLLNRQPHPDVAYQHRLSKIISNSSEQLPEPSSPVPPPKTFAPQSPLPLAKIIRTAEMAGQRDPKTLDSNGTLETGAATPSPPTSPSASLIKKSNYTRRRSSLRPHQPSHNPSQQPALSTKDQPPTRRIFSSTASRRASWHPGLPTLPTDAPSLPTILKNYAQSFLISIIIGLPCNALVYGLSLLGWRWGDDLVKWKADQTVPGGALQKDTMMSPTAFTVICTIMFTGALPIFNAVQFMAIHSWKAFRKTGLIWAAPLSCVFAAGSLWGLWYSGWPFWFYYIDVVIILLSYISCTFLSGYYGRRGTVPRLERLFDAIEFGIIECFVSVAAVFYGLWIMPIFSWIPDGYKMYWRFTVHPVYWELFVKFATRRLLIAKASSDLNAIDTLSLAHAQAHITVMQVSIVAGLESFESLFVAVFVFGALRFVIRSLASYEYHFRRFIVDKLWPFRVGGRLGVDPATELEIEKYMMAIDIQTEVVQENAAVLFASTLAYLFYRYGDLFSMTMPEDESFGVSHAVATVFIQLGVNAFFDLLGLWFNSRWASKLPFQRTWREMWGVGIRFFGFQG